ncbi:4'-phosphopantetheinyl transferase family protein [Streptomyces sp. NPDC059850]|uniref:4'-phosphopantetheinyl transferase family protein n=1 Tax=Streptomyces sp. NPDC059850 TaxID=3346970 RepID=UPI00365E0401
MPLIRPADDPAVDASWGPLAAPPRPGDRPGPGEVAVWLLHIPPYTSFAAEVADRTLDAGERERAAGMRHATARERYLTSHVGLRTLLGGYLGRDPADVEFTRETCGMPDCAKPHGRPALAGDTTLAFSLSHAGDAALCAVSGGAPVGADIEERNPRRSGDRLDGLIGQLHPGERAAIAALPDEEERERAFISCWVRKEAYLKGIGTGLPGGLRTHYVGLAEEFGAHADVSTPPGWAFADLPAPPGYHAAVAVRAEAAPAVTFAGLRLG